MTTMTANQARWYIAELTGSGKRWDVLHQRINWRRGNFANDQQYDPQLGKANDPDNPYKDVQPVQTDMLARAYRELVPRLVENDAVADVDPPNDTEDGHKTADQLAAVLNTWKADCEERAGYRWQTRIADGQVRLGYAVMEWGIDPDAWADDADAKAEHPRNYVKGLPGRRAEQGCPFSVSFPDPASCVLVFDESRKPGPAMYAKVQEVALLDYERSSRANSTTNVTAIVDMGGPDVGQEQQAPGFTKGNVSGGSTQTASSGTDWGKRVQVKCLWTRDEYFEFVDDEEEPRQAFEHYMGRIPVELIPAIDTGDPDPVYRWEPALEGLYRLKPGLDRTLTLAGAAVEMSVRPFTYLKQSNANAAAPLMGEDGTPETERSQSALQSVVPAGFEIGQVVTANPNQISQWVEFQVGEAEKSKPGTGQAEISATTAPWAARLAQQQANVSPKQLVEQAARHIDAMLNHWLDLCAKPADRGGLGENVSAYSYSGEEGVIDRSKVVTIPWKEIKGYRATVNINPMSSAEQTTWSQLMADFYERGLIVMDDFLEALGKKNPSEYRIRLEAEKIIGPYKEQKATQIVAAVLGQDVMLGQNGQGVAMGGQTVDPRQDLMARGWQPQGQPQAAPPQGALPGGVPGGPPTIEGVPSAQPMPGGGQLQAPGTMPIGAV